MHRVRSWSPLVGWLAALGAGIVLFTALGSGPLEAPPLGQPSSWGDWAAARDPIVAAVAVLRLLVLALSWYLVGVTTVGLVARLTRAARLVQVADALSLPVVRRVLQSAVGLTLAASVVASASGAAPAVARPDRERAPAAAAVALTGDPGSRASMVVADEASGAPEVMTVADDGAATASMVTVDPPTTRMVGIGPPGASRGPAAADGTGEAAGAEDDLTGADAGGVLADGEAETAATEQGAAADAAREHEVVAGDHLWSIAARDLEDHLGRHPSDAEVVVHWQRLVEDNRDRLANPDDPDLILPGQRFVLPDLPAGT